MAAAGDVNNDGFADVIVGQPRWSNGQTFEGRAYVFHGSGSAAGLPADPDWVVESDQANAFLGLTVSGAGDINGPQGGARFADVMRDGRIVRQQRAHRQRPGVRLPGRGARPVDHPSDTIDGALAAISLGTRVASAGRRQRRRPKRRHPPTSFYTATAR